MDGSNSESILGKFQSLVRGGVEVPRPVYARTIQVPEDRSVQPRPLFETVSGHTYTLGRRAEITLAGDNFGDLSRNQLLLDLVHVSPTEARLRIKNIGTNKIVIADSAVLEREDRPLQVLNGKTPERDGDEITLIDTRNIIILMPGYKGRDIAMQVSGLSGGTESSISWNIWADARVAQQYRECIRQG